MLEPFFDADRKLNGSACIVLLYGLPLVGLL
jgi:hypothetical protein